MNAVPEPTVVMRPPARFSLDRLYFAPGRFAAVQGSRMPDTIPFTILFPRSKGVAIEERYASSHARLRLTTGTSAKLIEYDPAETAGDVAVRVTTGEIVVVTDATILTAHGLAERLVTLLAAGSFQAVLPTTAESPEPAQRADPFEPYLALGQFDEQAALIEQSDRPELEPFKWGAADPGIYATRRATLTDSNRTLGTLLEGVDTALARRLFAHRFIALRGQPREDLLERVSPDATSVLEFGCGEGALAVALKSRQPCRVVGVELDVEAGRVAETRVDRLLSGDVREILTNLEETFDFAIGGDIIEHLDDPWEFLRQLKRVMRPGGRLLLSLPNIACWPIVQDVMNGRFDYVYIGITCVGHLRFFTRRTIEEMLEIAGWDTVSIEPQPEFRTPGYERFVGRIRDAGVSVSEDDLLAPGYYVTAARRPD